MSFCIFLLLIALVAALIYMMRRKTTSGGGCCGSIDTPESRIKPSDRNRSHYPYHYKVQIGGMVCSNCARKVENAFHTNDGIMARVRLSGKTSDVFSKQPLHQEDVREMLSGTAYTLLSFQSIDGNPVQ